MTGGAKLAVGVFLIGVPLGIAAYFYMWSDYEIAKTFCASIPTGMPADNAMGVAKANSQKVNLHVVSANEIRVVFGRFHSCSCQITLQSGKVNWTRAWCTD